MGKEKKSRILTKPCVIEYEGRIVGYGSRELRVETISCWLARTIIQTKHYSRRFVNNSYLHLGYSADVIWLAFSSGDMPLTLTQGVVLCWERITGAIWN